MQAYDIVNIRHYNIKSERRYYYQVKMLSHNKTSKHFTRAHAHAYQV